MRVESFALIAILFWGDMRSSSLVHHFSRWFVCRVTAFCAAIALDLYELGGIAASSYSCGGGIEDFCASHWTVRWYSPVVQGADTPLIVYPESFSVVAAVSGGCAW